ncbi:MAG: SLC13 family permease [Desulfofustis sp.]
MDLPVILVMIVLIMAILLFIFEWVRVDVVGIIMMVILPLLGLVTPKEAISGLSSNAVVSIIAVIIIGAGLDKTGAMNVLARILLRFAGKSESRIMLLISGTVAFISSFMQNIGAAALFDPEAAPFGLFAVTPVGLALVFAALGYFLVLGKLVLPSGQGEETSGPMSSSLMRTYRDIGSLREIRIPDSFEQRSTLAELEIRPLFFVTVISIAKAEGPINYTPMPEDLVGPGDTLAVNGAPDMIDKLAKANGWEIKEDLEIFAEPLSPNNAGIMEVIVSPRSDLTRSTLKSSEFRRKYGVNPLALFRGNKTYVAGLSTLILETGDALLLQGRWEKFHFLKEEHDLIFTEDVQGEILRTEKIKFAVGCLLLSLTLILAFHVQLSIALLAGALGMVLTKVMSIDEAYHSVDWMTVFLLGGLIPLGIAFEKTGAAKLIAESIMSMMGAVSPLILLTVIGLLTSFFTLVVSNVGATVLMVPLAMNMAGSAGADPRMAALVVAVACSNTFVLPTHQVNALVMRPGGYRTIDYFKAGSGMTVLYLVVMMASIYLFYGVSS